jgi:hypothetical protein
VRLEYLVLLASNDPGAAAAAVRQRCRIVSASPPRLLVVEADEQVAHGLRALPGVADVISATTGVLPDSLNETERLFAHAWQQRWQMHDKQRAGNGLNWDAEGFSPPDRPDPDPG